MSPENMRFRYEHLFQQSQKIPDQTMVLYLSGVAALIGASKMFRDGSSEFAVLLIAGGSIGLAAGFYEYRRKKKLTDEMFELSLKALTAGYSLTHSSSGVTLQPFQD